LRIFIAYQRYTQYYLFPNSAMHNHQQQNFLIKPNGLSDRKTGLSDSSSGRRR